MHLWRRLFDSTVFSDHVLCYCDDRRKDGAIIVFCNTSSAITIQDKKNKLIIHTDIKFIIHFEDIDFSLTEQIKEQYSSPYFESIFTNSLINYNTTLSRNNDFIE